MIKITSNELIIANLLAALMVNTGEIVFLVVIRDDVMDGMVGMFEDYR